MAKLYIVPTPIGNLEDITLRALKVLGEVSLILAEDTRTSSVLLNHFNISKPLRSYHKFNEHQTVSTQVDYIEQGSDVALISDAGTPAISDPGFLLVRECIRRGVEVETLPGATAFVPALVQSGLSSDTFTFIGFLPQKKGRQTALQALSTECRTMIFYESPYRVLKTLKDLCETLGPMRYASVSREISKIHEQTIRGTLEQLVGHFTQNTPKGEFVIVVAGLDYQSRLERDKKEEDLCEEC
ncbi:MAG: 16S rRNA (cytidine(1402)-2'-O)-methyltransferase [Alistipes sp.]|nr:16S rRNA (cytidine(1402)-2'-O)-methyltransferase [Candidatus Alistipes equi]